MRIDKNIKKEPARGGTLKYPWAEMEIGDSVLITENIHSARCAAVNYGRYHGKKFSSRKTEGGVRIWRDA